MDKSKISYLKSAILLSARLLRRTVRRIRQSQRFGSLAGAPTAVPDARILQMYNALRPNRSTKSDLLAIADEIRPEIPQTLRLLKTMGVQKITMLTGDHPRVAEAVARTIGEHAQGQAQQSDYIPGRIPFR